MTVLVTGFGAFDGGSNASERLIEALEDRQALLGHSTRQPTALALLPVDAVEAPRKLAALLEALRPTYLLMTGQAAGRARLSLEQVAANRLDFTIPDEAGRLRCGEEIEPGAPQSYAATWPDPAGAVDALQAAGIPAELSSDCGAFLCNQIFYAAMRAAARRPHPEPLHAMFLHLPLTPQQVEAGEPAALRHPGCPSLPMEAAVGGVAILLDRLPAAHPAETMESRA